MIKKFIFLLLTAIAFAADAGEVKEDLKKTGHDIKQTAKDVGHRVKGAAHEVGSGFKKGWHQIKGDKSKDEPGK